jgi:hypothetical protein
MFSRLPARGSASVRREARGGPSLPGRPFRGEGRELVLSAGVRGAASGRVPEADRAAAAWPEHSYPVPLPRGHRHRRKVEIVPAPGPHVRDGRLLQQRARMVVTVRVDADDDLACRGGESTYTCNLDICPE